MGRINLSEGKCLDQVSNPGPLALESDTIQASLYGLGISRKEKKSVSMKGSDGPGIKPGTSDSYICVNIFIDV